MLESKFRTILIRIILTLLEGLRTAGHILLSFILWLLGLFAIVGKKLLPLAVFFYKSMFYVRRRILNTISPLQHFLMPILSHRNIIHFVVVAIAFSTSIASLGTRVVRAEDLGTKSILYTVISESSEDLIDEDASSDTSNYPVEYLADIVAAHKTPEIDFDFIDEEYVDSFYGGSALSAPYGTSGNRFASTRTSVETYAVLEGDTISQIADKFSISIETLLWANKLTVRSYIRPGDKLVIPPLDGVIHIVKKGDTINSIANQYKADSKEILTWNKIGQDMTLAIGESLVVPGGKMPTPVTTTPRVSSPSNLFTGPKPPNAQVASGTNMLWPTSVYRITQYFGWRHTGLDVAGPTGTALYAAEDGIVEYSGWTNGYGQNVVINHGNGIKTRYAHASKIYVTKGNQVKKGDTIAAMGSTGRSTGPHIHFEVKINGKFKNPLEFISKPK